jgi:N6-adenosine-specific RNA methylase IME4
VEVRGLGGVGLAEAESVHVADAAEEMTRALAEIEGVDHKVLAQAGHIVSIIREQRMTPEEFVQWARENGMGPKAMAAAYVIARRERPGWNQVTEIVSAALLEAAGADLEHLEEIPVCGRPGLAIYLGLLERGRT